MLREARAAGYEVRLCYLWLPSVAMSLRRVRQRVRKGGHDVPEADLRRRFLPSLPIPGQKALCLQAGDEWRLRGSLVLNIAFQDLERSATARGSKVTGAPEHVLVVTTPRRRESA